MLSRLSIAATGAFLLFGAAGPAHASLTNNSLTNNSLVSNALVSNALVSNALTSNALTSNAMAPTGFLPAASAIGDLNGVTVQSVELPAVPR